MDHQFRDTAIASRSRCEAFCCNDPERKGVFDNAHWFSSWLSTWLEIYRTSNYLSKWTTNWMIKPVDHLRPIDPSSRFWTCRTSHPDSSSVEAICSRTQAYQGPALRLSRSLGDTDEGLERRPRPRRLLPRQRSRKSRLHIRFSPSPTRRGHRGTQNHLDSMWNETHQHDLSLLILRRRGVAVRQRLDRSLIKLVML